MDDVFEALRRRYPENEYVLVSEVRDDAGFQASRSCDYMALGLWPSRGLNLHGFELKKSRNDWRKEVKAPAKAETFFRYCDYWWLVTSGKEIVFIEEIPEPWGWIEITNSKCIVKKEAPKNTPQAISRGFLASLLKRASDKKGYVREEDIKDRLAAATEAGRQDSHFRFDALQRDLEAERKKISEIREKTGVDLIKAAYWDINRYAKLIKHLYTYTPEQTLDRLAELEKQAGKIHQDLKSVLDDAIKS